MNPFTRIWLNPRDTYRSASLDSLSQFLLVWAWGAAYAFDRSMFGGQMLGPSAGAHIMLCVLIGIVGGHIYFWSLAFAMELTGSWFRGRASTKEVRKALILDGIPKAVSAVPLLGLAILLGKEFFESTEFSEEHSLGNLLFYLAVLLAILALTI